MSSVSRELRKPKLLFEINISRRPYLRRFFFLLVIAGVAAAAWFALNMAAEQVDVDRRLLWVGQLAAVVILLLASVRAVVNLVRWRSRPNETIRFFNKGFTWETNGARQQYRWERLRIFREGGRGIYLGKWPLIQWGAHTLTMDDHQVFRLRPRHGDFRQMKRALRPYAAEVTGIRMGRRLRQEKPVRLHPRLIVWPGGLQIGKQELPWRVLSVSLKRGRLVIRADENQKTRTVGRFGAHSVDNLGGFIDLATATIRNHRAAAES